MMLAPRFWLDPVLLVWNAGFARHELRRVEAIVVDNVEVLRSGWDEFFAN
jgi:hypothetical protein